MNRELMNGLQQYFKDKAEPTDNEKKLLTELNDEMERFAVCYVSRRSLDTNGYDASDVSDEDMEQIAGDMGDMYCDSRYGFDLQTACDELGVKQA